MTKRTSLTLCTLLAAGALASSAIAGCGGSASESGFGSSGSSGDGTSGGGGASGSGGLLGGSSGGGADSGAQKEDECKKMDIVFVIDNSGSMQQEQQNLAQNFPKFVDVINNYKTKGGDQLDYRVAVTTSDDGKEGGKFIATRAAGAPNGCSPGPARPWLERADGDVAGAFSCRAQVGTNGSNIERPLESMLLSVTTATGANSSSNSNFVREDALLAFVVITDEDEGGTENKPKRPVSEYPPEFDKVKGERGRWASAVIAGPTACKSDGLGNAAEAKRLKEFITDVGKNGVFASICTGDLTDGLTQALTKFDQACREFPSGPVK
jgi:hypothetical protein